MKATSKTHTKLVAEAISAINKQLVKTPKNKKSIITQECRKNNLNENSIRQIGHYDRH